MIGRCQRDVGRVDLVDASSDPCVVRGHDLGAVGQVDLVPVVGRRVVRGGDDHAGSGVEVGDRPGEHGCRHVLVEQHRLDAVGGHHASGVGREHVALATGIEPDHDAAPGAAGIGVEDVPGEAGRRLPDDEPVHAQRPGTDGCSETCGPELQPATETVLQLARIAVEQRLQLVTDVGVGFGRQPTLDGGREVVVRHSTSVRSSTSGRGPTWEITSDAAIEPSRPHSVSGAPFAMPYMNPAA